VNGEVCVLVQIETREALNNLEAIAAVDGVDGLFIGPSGGSGREFVRTLYETQDRRINPRGGLIGAGHPLGATGIAQIEEIGQQLQGKSGKRQVSGAKVGLVQNMSAAATSSSVLILQS
jgi:acetyl-CoA acetyltransferase